MWSINNIIESLVGIVIALAVLFVIAWGFDKSAGDLVGWMALGIAASAPVSKR